MRELGKRAVVEIMLLNLKSGEEAEFLKLFISYNYTSDAMALSLSQKVLSKSVRAFWIFS